MSETPVITAPGPDTPFEIGLVMAGAISAGAYTAGFVDFLIQALDEWEKEKAAKSPACPPHAVRLRVLTGSSAGGMTAAMAAGQLGVQFQHATPGVTAPANNKLYSSWVDRIDIRPLLQARDLAGGRPLQSLLDSTVLGEIAHDALTFPAGVTPAARPYVADPLDVALTVTNLRGVPYAPSFANWSKTTQYEMTAHADHLHFVLGANPPTDPGAFWLRPHDYANPDTWGVLQAAALATGAFPVGLAPQLLRRPPAQYAGREWVAPGPYDVGGRHYCERVEKVPPHWPAVDAKVAQTAAYQYEFLCVDGGVMNNEPLDYARRILAGSGRGAATAGDRATQAVVMVSPFPNGTAFPAEYAGPRGIAGVVGTMFNAMISQARFKPQELALANDPDVYSRFIVVPRRGFRADGTPEPHTIACGSLGGFGGFLSRQFRDHDYQLGRRNGQWFLKQYFVLPSEGPKANRLFAHWTPEARAAHAVYRAGSGGRVKLDKLPIIPLVGTAAADVPPPAWPTFTEAELTALRPQIKRRLDRIVSALLRQHTGRTPLGVLARGAATAGWWVGRNRAVAGILKTIRDDLTERGLMGPTTAARAS